MGFLGLGLAQVRLWGRVGLRDLARQPPAHARAGLQVAQQGAQGADAAGHAADPGVQAEHEDGAAALGGALRAQAVEGRERERGVRPRLEVAQPLALDVVPLGR
jgi:hypothetical protein